MDIQHNLKVAEPIFLDFISNMSPELARWIQYDGWETDGHSVYFKFKSSQNSLNFKVYAGVDIGDIQFLLNASSNNIYEYFRKLKYDNI